MAHNHTFFTFNQHKWQKIPYLDDTLFVIMPHWHTLFPVMLKSMSWFLHGNCTIWSKNSVNSSQKNHPFLYSSFRPHPRFGHWILLNRFFNLALPSERHLHRWGGGSGLWTWSYQGLLSCVDGLFVCRGWWWWLNRTLRKAGSVRPDPEETL